MIGVGDRLKGISGGEKRRLAFASEVNIFFRQSILYFHVIKVELLFE
jgi:hypothetical protein